MIRGFKNDDLNYIMKLWLDTNIETHSFISKDYWINHFEMVKTMISQAEIYVYEDDDTDQIQGFIGLTGNDIAGIFVKKEVRSQGIGGQLLDFVKKIKTGLNLHVYQKNKRAICFYERQDFVVQAEAVDENIKEKEFVMEWRR